MIPFFEWLRGFVLVAAVAVAFAPLTRADEKTDAPEKSDGFAVLQRAAGRYEFRHEGEADRKLVRRPDALLRWTNPIRKTSDGAVYLWTWRGRPAVAMCVYTYMENGLDVELQSLLPTRLTGRRGDEDVWAPKTAGVTFAPVPKAPAPAATKRQRLVQMRGLARLFSGQIVRDNGREHALRMLPQPLERYQAEDGSVRDGGVFGFVLGTDPEILLLLEVRRDGDTLRWEYAFARMSSAACAASLAGKEVWSVDRWNWQPNPAEPYITFVGTRNEPSTP